jgi:hypothetical protein
MAMTQGKVFLALPETFCFCGLGIVELLSWLLGISSSNPGLLGSSNPGLLGGGLERLVLFLLDDDSLTSRDLQTHPNHCCSDCRILLWENMVRYI